MPSSHDRIQDERITNLHTEVRHLRKQITANNSRIKKLENIIANPPANAPPQSEQTKRRPAARVTRRKIAGKGAKVR